MAVMLCVFENIYIAVNMRQYLTLPINMIYHDSYSDFRYASLRYLRETEAVGNILGSCFLPSNDIVYCKSRI